MSDWSKIVEQVRDELNAAVAAWPPMHSAHEGLAVLQEEVHELAMEVYRNPNKWPDRNERIRREAVQVAAMAIRLIGDVCDSD